MEQIINYVKPELVLMIPALYFIGAGLKNSQRVPDKDIPLLLGAVGIILAALWVTATTSLAGWQSVLLAVFTATVQGVLCAGLSVYVNQVIKQGQKSE